jgi:hypothetical protein
MACKAWAVLQMLVDRNRMGSKTQIAWTRAGRVRAGSSHGFSLYGEYRRASDVYHGHTARVVAGMAPITTKISREQTGIVTNGKYS